MKDKPRRTFLKQSAALVSGLSISACRPESEAPDATRASQRSLERETLTAVAAVVLPRSALGVAGVSRVVRGFEKWLEGYEAGAELDHPYLWTDEILHAPRHPGPLWSAQLEALSLASSRRYGVAFTELAAGQQEELVREQLPQLEEQELPPPEHAPHVALGLLGYFYQTPEANDLCYEARIERHGCRGLDTAADEPAGS